MATLRLHYLSDPKILRSIEAKRLIPLLTPHAGYLRERGLELPPATEAAQLDLEQLADIVATPRSDTPQSLLDALFMINELSTRRGMESLIAAAARAGIPLVGDGKLAPADVAVQIWLHSPSIVEEQHARVLLSRPRRFDSFQSRVGKAVTSFAPFAKHIAAVEHDLDNWGEPKQLGRGTRVFMFPADHELRFLIRRGDPYRREESLDDGNVSSVFYHALYQAVLHHFGSWRAGLTASGINLANVSRRRPKDFTREAGILWLQERHAAGQTVVWTEVCLENRDYAIAIRRTFRSWRNALIAAGLHEPG